MLFFGANTKGFCCLPTLQGTKNISHNEIRLKQENTEESITHLSAVGWQMCLGDESPDPCSISSIRGRFEPALCSWEEGLAPDSSWGTMVEPPASASS